MKFKGFLVLLLFGLSFLKSYGQEKNNFISRIYFYPLGMHIGNNHIQELGLGVFEFNYRRPYNLELGLKLSRKIFSKYYFEGGLSLKYWNLEFEYIINDPFYEDEIFAHEKRYIRKIVTSPYFGLHYNHHKFAISIGLEANVEVTSRSNVISGQSPIYVFFDPSSQTSSNLTISENNLFLNDFNFFLTPTLTFGYKISQRWSIEVNSKIKPYGDWPLYHLAIEGKMPDMEDGLYTLNDTRILNEIIFVHIGASYYLNKTITK